VWICAYFSDFENNPREILESKIDQIQAKVHLDEYSEVECREGQMHRCAEEDRHVGTKDFRFASILPLK
jgi:hypothetical protein